MKNTINDLAQAIYEQNKQVGWWDNPNRDPYEIFQLVSTEIAEATEGDRKSLMDDKLTHYPMEHVELADALIRVLDVGAYFGWSYDESAVSGYEDLMTMTTHAGQHLMLNRSLVRLAEAFMQRRGCHQEYTALVNRIFWVARKREANLLQIAQEKLAFNLTRPDHQRENRSKPGGKAY